VVVEVAVLESICAEAGTGTIEGRHRSCLGRQSRYSLVGLDLIAAAVSAVVVYGARVGGVVLSRQSSVIHSLVAVLMPLMWVLMLALHGAYRWWPVAGAAKARGPVLQAALSLVAVVSWASLALHHTALVDQIAVGIPAMATVTILMRQSVARWARGRGGNTHVRRALMVGHATSIASLLAAIERNQTHDVRGVAACLVADATDAEVAALPVPVYSDIRDVTRIARAAECNTVIVSPCAELDMIRLRRLSWELHDRGIELLVAPALAEVARERLSVLPTGTVPLLHVRAPVLAGPQHVLKGLLDRVGAACLLAIAAPLMLVIAVLVRSTSSGPVLFRQRRVGRNGAEFTCLKFRTMTVDAEARRAELEYLNECQDGPLFKIRRDPRVTRLGAVLRRYSLDELPQLANVLKGDMSLVGPRPPLPREVAGYDDAVRRRLLVKPGMTGLWQVSGRMELSWGESVQLDLSYVDNWSPALEARILLRTVAAVVKGTGAY
jgi:exopolysaccharide biosynthesis polyprenyl glycosylphosphotransferase